MWDESTAGSNAQSRSQSGQFRTDIHRATVGGNYIRRNEVDVAGEVGLAVGVEVAAVGVRPALVGGAFDLDAAEAGGGIR